MTINEMHTVGNFAIISNLIMFRVIGFFVTAPYFNEFGVPKKVLAMIAVLISYVLASNPTFIDMYASSITYKFDVVLCIENMFVGFVFGVAMLMAVEFIKIAGKKIAFAMQMGFSQMVDPVNGKTTDGISNTLYIIFSLVFISGGGINMMLDAIWQSFITHPLDAPIFKPDQLYNLFKSFSYTFLFAAMMALPFVGAGLLLNAALAICSKTAPAMNLFSIGFPLTIMLGFFIFSMSVDNIISDLTSFLITLKENHIQAIL